MSTCKFYFIFIVLFKLLKVCYEKSLVFPGQGSQKIGMGKEFFDNFQIAKEVFQNVDDSYHKIYQN